MVATEISIGVDVTNKHNANAVTDHDRFLRAVSKNDCEKYVMQLSPTERVLSWQRSAPFDKVGAAGFPPQSFSQVSLFSKFFLKHNLHLKKDYPVLSSKKLSLYKIAIAEYHTFRIVDQTSHHIEMHSAMP